MADLVILNGKVITFAGPDAEALSLVVVEKETAGATTARFEGMDLTKLMLERGVLCSPLPL